MFLFFCTAWLFLLLLVPFRSVGQNNTWSLKKCIDYALSNNIQLKQADLNSQVAAQELNRSKAVFFPTLNGFVSHDYNFGRTIDPFTNQFATNRVQSNSFVISSNLTLFNGFQAVNTLGQNKIEYEAGKLDVVQMQNEIALSVASAYLQILLAEEFIAISDSQVKITQQQMERVKKLVDAGTLSRGSLLDIEAQLAAEEVLSVNYANQKNNAYLLLVQVLNLESAQGFIVERPILDTPVEALLISPDDVYHSALKNQPGIRSAELRVVSSQKGLFAARGTMGPRLSLAGLYGTGFSELRKEPAGSPVLSGYETVGVTSSNDLVLVPSYAIETRTIPFNKQVKDNINKSFGFNLVIPVFNGFSSRLAVNKAKIAIQTAELNLEANKRNLEKLIEQAYANATAAFKKYHAVQKSVEAQKESFKYMEQRLNVGMINTVEYNDSKNKLHKAESELIQSKYDYIFKVKILDFYQGKPLSQ